MSVAKKLKELPATAICGNDISSSCLYVSGLAVIYAGQYAWVALLIVAAVLFLFRKIYGEVVGAIPLNGGAYNALLNTTGKSVASLAACLTLLSYMATAAISSNEALHYLSIFWDDLPALIGAIVLLGLFMVLTIIGLKESSRVAVVIFLFHLFSLTLLTAVCIYSISVNGFDILSENYQTPVRGGSLTKALFFGFAASMLGISGFESSSNFVEEQAAGVFPKTLRNMWIVVSVFNPLMAFLVLAMMPMSEVAGHENALLAHLGDIAGGKWLSYLISINAAMVLSGAVLTSFVGVGGLVERMTLDRILPQFLLKKNKKRTAYRITIMFFLLCTSILLITGGKLEALAGVYTISFLAVMALFALGNILLKAKRKKLPRPERATGLAILIAFAAVIAAIIGNAKMNPEYLKIFFRYFFPAIGVVAIMLYRISILKAILSLIRYIFDPIRKFVLSANRNIQGLIDEINAQEFVFFTKDDNVAVLNKVMIYIKNNEHTRKLKIVTVLEEDREVNMQLIKDIEVLDREYPEIDIEFITLKDTFGPELINQLSKDWKIPVNFMFIGSPGDRFPYRVEELGGVRLII